jgi:hypothetical protein
VPSSDRTIKVSAKASQRLGASSLSSGIEQEAGEPEAQASQNHSRRPFSVRFPSRIPDAVRL